MDNRGLWATKCKLLKFAAALLICLALMLPAVAGATNQAVLDAAKSVVRIYAESDYSMYASIGSGFAVGKAGEPVEYIITNFHVIEDEDDPRDGIYDIIYVVLDNINNGGSLRAADLVCYNKNADYCILRIAPTYERSPMALMSATTVERTQEVYALGFPGVADDINDDGESLPSTIEDVSITRGVISKTNSKWNNYDFLQMDTVINSGNSGGPLVTESGFCVGINSFGVSGSTTNGAMFIDHVIRAMNDRGIPYIMAGSIPPKPVEDIDDLITPAPTLAPAADGNEELTTWEWVQFFLFVLGMPALLAIVVLISMIAAHKKKKKQARDAIAEPKYEQFAQQSTDDAKTRILPPSSIGRFSLVGVTGVYSGSVFPINAEVVIGRDVGACNIVFSENAPGISGRHCRIIPGKDALVIEDLGSTYGTFLKDGNRTRLEPGKRKALPDGTGFFLAVEDNSFIVKREQ